MCIDATRRHSILSSVILSSAPRMRLVTDSTGWGRTRPVSGVPVFISVPYFGAATRRMRAKPRFFTAGSKQNSPFRSWKHGCARLFPHTTARLRNAARRAVGWVRLRYFTHDLKGTVSTHLRIGVPITVSSILCGVLRRVTSPR